jgi:lipid-A-disaccharide synthase
MLSYQTEIFISAGEQSGDLHASSLIKEIKNSFQETNIKFTGLGGNKMKNENAELLYHIDELGIVGFTDVLKNLFFIKKVLNECVEYIRRRNPKIVILVDYPGFNMKLSERIRSFYKGKIIYFIAPQIWAWHGKRILSIKKNVDKVLVILPFEESIYREHDINVKYIGHPLITKIKKYISENPKQNKIFGEPKRATFLPGSRISEVNHHLPILIETADRLKREFDIEINISNSNPGNIDIFEKFKNSNNTYNVIEHGLYNSILNSDLVITKSGTSTLECALFGVPFFIFYKTNLINYLAAKRLVKIDKVGLANIVAGKFVVKEFIQNEFNSDNLIIEARKILTDSEYSDNMRKELSKTWDILGDTDCFKSAVEEIKEFM